MFKVEMTINGKPLNQTSLRNELERAMLQAAIEATKKAIQSSLTPEEAQQITVDFRGGGFENLSASISGPDEIVKKVEAAFSE